MAIRVRISGTRPLRSAVGASSLAGRGWVSPMPGDLVEVRLQDGSWAAGIVSLYGNYPGGTSLRVSVGGGQPTYFARCDVRLAVQQARSVEPSSPEVSATSTAKRRHRHRSVRRKKKMSFASSAMPYIDAESAESSNGRYF